MARIKWRRLPAESSDHGGAIEEGRPQIMPSTPVFTQTKLGLAEQQSPPILPRTPRTIQQIQPTVTDNRDESDTLEHLDLSPPALENMLGRAVEQWPSLSEVYGNVIVEPARAKNSHAAHRPEHAVHRPENHNSEALAPGSPVAQVPASIWPFPPLPVPPLPAPRLLVSEVEVANHIFKILFGEMEERNPAHPEPQAELAWNDLTGVPNPAGVIAHENVDTPGEVDEPFFVSQEPNYDLEYMDLDGNIRLVNRAVNVAKEIVDRIVDRIGPLDARALALPELEARNASGNWIRFRNLTVTEDDIFEDMLTIVFGGHSFLDEVERAIALGEAVPKLEALAYMRQIIDEERVWWLGDDHMEIREFNQWLQDSEPFVEGSEPYHHLEPVPPVYARDEMDHLRARELRIALEESKKTTNCPLYSRL